MTVFFTADPHFGDANIIRYEDRPYASTEQMDQALIENWNRIVSLKDEVFVLGDFSVYGKEKNKEILAKLNGTKTLVLGNHDRQYSEEEWKDMGFAHAYQYPILWNGFWLLSHEPIYVNSHIPYANVFGHVHANPQYVDASAFSCCVSVERTGYRPVSFAEVKALIHSHKQ